MADDALATLQVRPWPGNLSQLRNNVERMLILAAGDPSEPITADMMPTGSNRLVGTFQQQAGEYPWTFENTANMPGVPCVRPSHGSVQ